MIMQMKNRKPRTCCGHWASRLMAAVMLLGGAGAASACVATSGGTSITGGLRYDDEIPKGTVVLDWQDVPRRFFERCAPGATAQIEFKPALDPAEAIGGNATFRSPYRGSLGVQFYVAGHGVVDADGATVTATATRDDATGQYSISVEVSHRIVALANIGGDDDTGYMSSALEVKDETFGQDLASLDFDSYNVTRNRYSSCGFSSSPPEELTVPTAYTSGLRHENSRGAELGFSFSWSCSIGNQPGDRDGGDFAFSSPNGNSTDGRLKPTGTASGVDLLVTLTNSKGDNVPVKFDGSWYSNDRDFQQTGGGLPSSGTQQMQVSFIRNKDELNPGDASASMTITVEPW